MKTCLIAALFTLLLFTGLSVHGQEINLTNAAVAVADEAAALATDGADSTAPKWLVDVIDKALDKQPWLVILFTVMGVLRTIIKPVTLFLEQRAKETPDTKDDEKIARVTGSKIFKLVTVGLDYVASVKLPPKKP